MADDFKKKIAGYRGSGRTCGCCQETDIKASRKLARTRLAQEDRKEFAKVLSELDELEE